MEFFQNVLFTTHHSRRGFPDSFGRLFFNLRNYINSIIGKDNELTIEKRPFDKLSPVPFEQVELTDKFWAKRQEINRDKSIHVQYQKLEENHQINNFRIAAGVKEGVHQGWYFLDSDLYKWLEGVNYFLHVKRDPELEIKVDELIELFRKAQHNDGYINTFFSLNFPEKRLSNWYVFHEMYCAGHLIEAAIAHYQATGKKNLLRIAEKFADLFVRLYLEGKREGVPGHEELELALIKLFRITHKVKYLNLAKELIDRRGHISNFRGKGVFQTFDREITLARVNKIREKFEKTHPLKNSLKLEYEAPAIELKFTLKNTIRFFMEHWTGRYAQLNVPVRDAFEPVGHCVRAMYLYSAMADLYSETGEKALLSALQRIWVRMVKSRMYVTGGIGSVGIVESFGRDFELNNEESYSESCAAIGSMMWNWRMIQITGDAKYADLLEKLLYNAFLVGQSIDGLSYTYNNPLVSHGNDKRYEWFECACCPPNVARTIASLGKYIYSTSEGEIWIHQYIGNQIKIMLNGENHLKLILESEIPWKGNVKLTLELEKDQDFTLYFRIPIWCNNSRVLINSEKLEGELKPGTYASVTRTWSNSDVIELKFDMEPRLELSDTRIKDNRDKVAISYGPLIYCLEQQDNQEDIFILEIPENPELKVVFKSNLLGGVNTIQGTSATQEIFTAIPYYVWCNRGPNKMQIWIKKEKKRR